MKDYELYINDKLCTLGEDTEIALIYQSPIFSELDVIQSNRSYTIDLPIEGNSGIIESADRADAVTGLPYKRMNAALYAGGVPLFTQGYAVITEITDVISITLTWGNVDNFQPLFDNDMADLSDTLYEMGVGNIPWNAYSKLVNAVTHPKVGFFAIDYGRGLEDIQYIHPAIHIKPVIEAIEKANSITIKDKERLYTRTGIPTDAYIFPCVTKNGDEKSSWAESFVAQPEIYNANQFDYGYGYIRWGGRVEADNHDISVDGHYIDVPNSDKIHVIVKNPVPGTPTFIVQALASYGYVTITFQILGHTYYRKNEPTVLFERKSSHVSISGPDARYTDYTFDEIDEALDVSEYDFLSFRTKEPLAYNPNFESHIYPKWVFMIYDPEWDLVFPTLFPIGPNLPDMSQGDFISALLLMNGLFAYADKDRSDTICLISPDELYDNIKAGKYIDWSDKVIIDRGQDPARPDTSVFAVEDYARKNIIDYENDEDVRTDTSGTILIDNHTLEAENEIDFPFSASENLRDDKGNAYAKIPLYADDAQATFSESTPRILTWHGSPIAVKPYVYGYFAKWQKFGGEEGIVATRYQALQKILGQLRIVTVRLSLTPVDIANLSFHTPVYLKHLGGFFAIYTIETRGEECECKLIKL